MLGRKGQLRFQIVCLHIIGCLSYKTNKVILHMKIYVYVYVHICYTCNRGGHGAIKALAHKVIVCQCVDGVLRDVLVYNLSHLCVRGTLKGRS